MKLSVVDQVEISTVSNQTLRPGDVLDLGEDIALGLLKSHPHHFVALDVAPAVEQALTDEPTTVEAVAPMAAEAPTDEPTMVEAAAPVAAEAPTDEPTTVEAVAPVAAEAPNDEPTMVEEASPVAEQFMVAEQSLIKPTRNTAKKA